MGAKTPSARPAGAPSEMERELAALCDPVALEARLKAARARRAEALARRKAGLDLPAPRPVAHRGFAEPPGPAFAGPAPAAMPSDPAATLRGLASRARATFGRFPARPAPVVAGAVALLALAALSLIPGTRDPAGPEVVTAGAAPAAPEPADASPPEAVAVAPPLVERAAPVTEPEAAPPSLPRATETAAADPSAAADPTPAPLPGVTDVARLSVEPADPPTGGAGPGDPGAPVLAPMPRATAPDPVPETELETATTGAGPAAGEPAATPRPEQVLVYTSAGAAGAPLAEALGQAGFTAVTTQPSRHAISASNVRYYHADDAAAAAAIAAALGPSLPDGAASVRDFTNAERRTAAGRIEVWVAGNPAAPAPPRQARASESDEIQRLVESVMDQPAVSNTLRAVDRSLRDLDRGVQRTASEIERSWRNATR